MRIAIDIDPRCRPTAPESGTVEDRSADPAIATVQVCGPLHGRTLFPNTSEAQSQSGRP